MTLNDYLEQRSARDPEFRAEREMLRPKHEFHRALIRARLDAGFTQTELTDRIGTKQSAIARLEGGTAQPSFDMLRRLSRAFSVSFEIMPSAEIQIHHQDNVPA